MFGMGNHGDVLLMAASRVKGARPHPLCPLEHWASPQCPPSNVIGRGGYFATCYQARCSVVIRSEESQWFVG